MKEHVDRIMKQYGQGCERCLTGEIDQGKAGSKGIRATLFQR